MVKRLFFAVIAFSLLAWQAKANDEARLLRFPAIHGQHVVFSYGGDLYSVGDQGGMARRLTADNGYEIFPRFSPDGSTIAFTAQYDGNTEIYRMPAQGGIPKRLSYTATLSRDDVADRMGPNNIAMGWTPNGNEIVYRSRKKSFNDFIGQLYKVPANGGLSSQLPFSEGGFMSYSPDGKMIAFNRVFREFRTWKYYAGGMADDIWIFNFETEELQNITNNPAQDIIPMWYGDNIYFLSDRNRNMNLFVYSLQDGSVKQLTQFTDYDIKFPNLGDGRIVFEQAGYIHILDLSTNEIKKLEIFIENDQPWARDEFVDAKGRITNFHTSGKGYKGVFSARGEILSIERKQA